MNVETPIPRVYTARLSSEQVTSLLCDLRDSGVPVTVQIKSGDTAQAQTPGRDLDAVAHALQRQQAVQMRYTIEDVRWCDTLMVRADVVQLVRCPIPTDR